VDEEKEEGVTADLFDGVCSTGCELGRLLLAFAIGADDDDDAVVDRPVSAMDTLLRVFMAFNWPNSCNHSLFTFLWSMLGNSIKITAALCRRSNTSFINNSSLDLWNTGVEPCTCRTFNTILISSTHG